MRHTVKRAISKGVGLYYETMGAGSPLLLVNGLGISALGWEPEFLRSLATRYRILTFDHRGTGRSDRPDCGYSIPEMVDDCLAICDAEKIESAHLLGASMGGRIVLHLAIAYPVRVRSQVICCSNCGRREKSSLGGVLSSQALKAFFRRRTESRVNSGSLEFFFTKDFIKKNRERLEAHWRRVSEYPTPIEVYEKQLEATMTHCICERLGEITVPTLVLGGDSDRFNPVERLEELGVKIPMAQIHIYSGLGHGFMFEAREDVTRRILEFLDGISDSATNH